MAGINLGPEFNAELVALAGWDTNTVDPSTITVDYLNPGGPTTVRGTASINVDTDALTALIRKYVPAGTPDTPPDEPTS